MVGRTPAEAVQNLLDSLQRAISCVSPAVLITTGYHPRTEGHSVFFIDAKPVRLRGDGRISLEVLHRFSLAEHAAAPRSWQASTTGYAYTLYDADGQEIVAYHWHATGPSTVVWPHLHLGAGARVGHAGLADTHLPTGRIMLEDVLHAAITGLGVRPLRTDWERVFEETRAARES